MPIKEYLHGHQFSPEVIQLMGVAFEMARASNKLLVSIPPELSPLVPM
jgi:hypothetical protein